MNETNEEKTLIASHDAEDALLRAKLQLNFISLGLEQREFEWDEDSIGGLNFLLSDIEKKVNLIHEWFHQKNGRRSEQ